MDSEDKESSRKEKSTYCLSVYDNMPEDNAPPKHWTQLPEAERNDYLAKHPATRHLIAVAVLLSIWIICVALVLSGAYKASSKGGIVLIYALLGWIGAVYYLWLAWKSKS